MVKQASGLQFFGRPPSAPPNPHSAPLVRSAIDLSRSRARPSFQVEGHRTTNLRSVLSGLGLAEGAVCGVPWFSNSAFPANIKQPQAVQSNQPVCRNLRKVCQVTYQYVIFSVGKCLGWFWRVKRRTQMTLGGWQVLKVADPFF